MNSYGKIYTPPKMVKENLLYVNGSGYIVRQPEFCIKRQWFSDYLLMCCLSGKMYIEQFGEKKTLPAGKSCLMNLEEPHYYYSDQEKPCEILWLHFGGKTARDILPILLSEKTIRIFDSGSFPVFVRRCIKILDGNGKNVYYQVSGILYQIVMSGIAAFDLAYGQEGMKTDEFIRELDAYMEKNLSRKLSLEQMASDFHFNKSYLCRKVRSVTGMTPMQYFMNKKIQTAKYRLDYTEQRIADIAEQLGFYDQNHFSYSFYKAEGCYPSVYRKRSRNP